MLKIKLLVPISEEKGIPLPRSASRELTLGDVIEFDKGEEAASKRKPS
jgi:ribosome-binding protein aMBF1 (putative translation factor)